MKLIQHVTCFIVSLGCVAWSADSSTAFEPIAAQLNVTYDETPEKKLQLDVHIPNGDGPFPAVVIVHGGGWINGKKESFRTTCEALAKRGYVTVNVEYRLAGEAPFPAAVLDVKKAIRYVRKNAVAYRIDPNRIGAIGGSAGGHLVGMVATTAPLKHIEPEGTGDSTVRCAILMGAGVDQVKRNEGLEKSIPNCVLFFGGTLEEKRSVYEQGSPITHVSALTPPLLFLDGELDNPGQRYGDMRAKLDALKVHNEFIMVPGAKHGEWSKPQFLPAYIDVYDKYFTAHLRKE